MVNRGDLILYPVCKQSDWIDRAIGQAEFDLHQNVGGVQFEHCAVSMGNEMTYEAKWPKTGKQRIDRSRPFFIYNIVGIKPEEIEKGMAWLEAHEGEYYSLPALLTAGWCNPVHMKVCSTYMAGYIRATGKATQFLDDKDFVTPDKILLMVAATRVLEKR